MPACLQVAPQVDELVTGSISVEEFITVTSPSSISQGIAATVLPSAVASPSGAGSRSFGSSNTQAADSSSSDSGLSGGAIAGIVIGCIAGVALIALAALLVTKRRDAGRADTTPTESGPRRVSASACFCYLRDHITAVCTPESQSRGCCSWHALSVQVEPSLIRQTCTSPGQTIAFSLSLNELA